MAHITFVAVLLCESSWSLSLSFLGGVAESTSRLTSASTFMVWVTLYRVGGEKKSINQHSP